jgi:DNA-binding response OmpR family regulator
MNEERTRRLLLLEPDPRFAKLVEGYLEARGWTVLWTEDGRQALARLQEIAPDAVLMELDLPHVDALELAHAIGQHPRSPPVVVCTRAPRVRSWSAITLAQLGLEAALCRPVRLSRIAEVLDLAVTTRAAPESVAARQTAPDTLGADVAASTAKAKAVAAAKRAALRPRRTARAR